MITNSMTHQPMEMTTELAEYLELHLLPGEINKFDNFKSAMIGSFQEGIKGARFQNVWFYTGQTSGEMIKDKDYYKMPLFGLLKIYDSPSNVKKKKAKEIFVLTFSNIWH